MGEPGCPDSAAPAVSIIMIFLDAAEFISQAIDSVREQTFVDWELLLVNDGSTDGSSEIAARYAAADPVRIRCLRHPDGGNHGTGASRALGLSEARGDYIAFLDADDVFERERLAVHIEALEDHPGVVVAQSLLVYWFNWAGSGSDQPEPPVFPGESTIIRPPGMLLLTLATTGARVPGVCSVTARADAIRQVGGFEREFGGVYEDQVLWMKLYLHGDTLVINRYLARYRQHSASLTKRAHQEGNYTPGKPHAIRERLFHWLQNYLRQLGVDAPELRPWIAEELRTNSAGSAQSFRFTATQKLKDLLLRLSPGPLRRRILTTWQDHKRRHVEQRVQQVGQVVLQHYSRQRVI